MWIISIAALGVAASLTALFFWLDTKVTSFTSDLVIQLGTIVGVLAITFYIFGFMLLATCIVNAVVEMT